MLIETTACEMAPTGISVQHYNDYLMKSVVYWTNAALFTNRGRTEARYIWPCGWGCRAEVPPS